MYSCVHDQIQIVCMITLTKYLYIKIPGADQGGGGGQAGNFQEVSQCWSIRD